jgi:hypothetical protein
MPDGGQTSPFLFSAWHAGGRYFSSVGSYVIGRKRKKNAKGPNYHAVQKGSSLSDIISLPLIRVGQLCQLRR